MKYLAKNRFLEFLISSEEDISGAVITKITAQHIWIRKNNKEIIFKNTFFFNPRFWQDLIGTYIQELVEINLEKES